MIPKIIWQTHEWKWDDLPSNFRSAALTWKNLNPTWEYRYVGAADRAKQIESFDSTLYLFYKHMDKTSQADLWRYVTVYQNGGVYSDMDSVCATPLDYVLNDMPKNKQVLCTPVDADSGTINNANFGATKESLILGEILDKISNIYDSTTLSSVFGAIESGLTLTEAIQHQIKLGPENFYSIAFNYVDLIWPNYIGPIHGDDIKDPNYRVPRSFKVNFYGKTKRYKDLAAENNWNLL